MSDPVTIGGQIGAAVSTTRGVTAASPASGDKNSSSSRPGEGSRGEAAFDESVGRYNVTINPETLRVITEVVDPTTGDVLFYLPPGYRPTVGPSVGAGSDPSDNGTA